jgi:hypothetical protein
MGARAPWVRGHVGAEVRVRAVGLSGRRADNLFRAVDHGVVGRVAWRAVVVEHHGGPHQGHPWALS